MFSALTQLLGKLGSSAIASSGTASSLGTNLGKAAAESKGSGNFDIADFSIPKQAHTSVPDAASTLAELAKMQQQ
jgi:hypothetical protein